jgi:hypothetical protein
MLIYEKNLMIGDYQSLWLAAGSDLPSTRKCKIRRRP